MGFYIFISVLVLIVCVLLGIIVLVQNPKGGGLSSTFGGQAGQFMGARQQADFLEKATWTLAIILLVLSLIGAYCIPNRNTTEVGAPQTELSVDEADELPGLPATLPEAE